jgi:putative restriction endonuclease
MNAQDLDTRVRLEAFAFLEQQTERHGTELPRELLVRGFDFQGERVPLMAPQGIFKPAVLPELPLSITTAPPSDRKPAAYDDQLDEDGILAYRYRGTDPNHRDNAGLRLAMRRQVPLAYFYGIVPGRYEAIWPVFVVGDDPARLTFTVVAEDRTLARARWESTDTTTEGRRRYITTLVQRRLHQQAFRERVLQAYQVRCGICLLRQRELLDAAHILPDRHPRGEPVVSNGLALCTLHHAAFDRQILGIRPDLIVEVRQDVLREADGPMLRHGLQEFQGVRLLVPRREEQRPNPIFLAERYELFRRAG